MPAERRGAITGASFTGSSSSSSNNNNNNNTTNMASGFTFGAAPAATGAAPAPPAFGAAPATTGAPTAFGAAPAPGAAAPAPFGAAPSAPAAGGFSFGSPAPGATAPTPAGGSLFGTPSSGSLFGSTPAPGGSVFGAPAPTPGGSIFGASAPAPGGSLFGTPAPATGSVFGAPAPGGSLFGGAAPGAAVAPMAPPPALAGYKNYADLPPDQKQAIDRLHQTMMQHKRTILQVSTMAPKLLESSTQQADAAAGQTDQSLKATVRQLDVQVKHLQQTMETLRENTAYTKVLYDKSMTQAYMFAKWPTEAIAQRRGVQLTRPKTAPGQQTQAQLQTLLDQQMVHVDRVERMPSPYLWQVLEGMEQRLASLKREMEVFKNALEQSKKIRGDDVNVTEIVKQHEMLIWKIANGIANLHERVEEVRHLYRQTERGNNVLEEADRDEKGRKRQIDEQLMLQMVNTLPATSAPAAPAPAPGGFGFGSAPAPGPSIFGGTPTPATGSIFGAAPKSAGGSIFGAPTPGGSIFGSPPAPAGGSLFGSTTPAPAGGGMFGSATPAPAPAAGGFSFGGATPAAAPATEAAPAFGFGAAPAGGGGLFGSAQTATTTPKSKNKTRGRRR